MTTMQNGAPGGAADGRTLPWRDRMRRTLEGNHRPLYGCTAVGAMSSGDRIKLGIEATRRFAVVVSWLQAIVGHDAGLTFAIILDACADSCAEGEDAPIDEADVELRRNLYIASCALLDLVEQYGECRRASSVRHWLSGVVGARVGCKLGDDGLALHRCGKRGPRALWRVDRRPSYEMRQVGDGGEWVAIEIETSDVGGDSNG